MPVAQQSPLKVMLIDDHPVVRMGLSHLIGDQPDMAICGEAGTVSEALDLVQTAHPDVAVVDLSLGESSGLDLVRTLKVSHPSVRVLVLSMHDERLFAERALRAGAGGYIMKREAQRHLLDALRRVANGGTYLSPPMTDRVIAAATGRGQSEPGFSPIERLTDRERDVFVLIGEGHGTRDIADGLHVSVKTVESHRAHIKKKLGLKTASELLRFATTWSSGA